MTTKMISEETLQPQAQEETRITPRDLRRVFWRSFRWSSRGTMSGR